MIKIIQKLVLVIGDMLELGKFSEELHLSISETVKNVSPKLLVTVGSFSKTIAEKVKNDMKVFHFKTYHSVYERLIEELDDNDIVMIKGSNSINLSKICERLKKNKIISPSAVIGFWPANSDGDDILIFKDNSRKKILKKLEKIYENRGFNLVCISNKWSFRTSEDLSKTMALQKSTFRKLSKATIETLAIIVYHQPVTRSEIEEIRGVSFASNTLETLLELNWVRPAGRKDVPGKPIQYATTENFLDHFNIQKLSDLPTIDELGSAGLIDTSSIDKSIFGTGKFFKEQSISKNQNIYEEIDEAIKKLPKRKNKDIYLSLFIVYILNYGN